MRAVIWIKNTKNNLVKEINDNNQQAIDNLKEHQTYVSSSNEKKGFLARLFNLYCNNCI